MITVADIVALMQEKAPFENAEPWDNSGLLVGDESALVSTVLVSLDITEETVAQAVAANAQLMVCHHPVIFDPLRSLPSSHLVYQLAQHKIAALCVHTNLDKAVEGVNDRLAQQLGLKQVTVAADGMSRIGRLPTVMTAETFGRHVSASLGTAVRLKNGTSPIQTVAVCGGAGAELVLPLLRKADAAVTGEVKHHEWLAVSADKTLADGGHFATENAVTDTLVRWLSQAFPTLTVCLGAQTPPYETIKD